MKVYIIKKGTVGKLITQTSNENVVVSDWITKKELTFDHPVLDAIGYTNMNPKPSNNSLAVRLMHEGYSMFSESGNGTDKYTLAVKATDVELLI